MRKLEEQGKSQSWYFNECASFLAFYVHEGVYFKKVFDKQENR